MTEKIDRIVTWLDATLDVASYANDVSNNGIQIARRGERISTVAFAVDGSLASVKAAAAAGAQMLVVHHGISWGGGIKRLDGGVYNVVKAAMEADLALYAVHLPLDANAACGNNWELARTFGLQNVRPAFSYHGYVIGVVGEWPSGLRVGICSGGAGSFAEEAKRLGCALYVTGEADWGEVIAAENCGMAMLCLGHYATETFGVKALARRMASELAVKTVFVGDHAANVAKGERAK